MKLGTYSVETYAVKYDKRLKIFVKQYFEDERKIMTLNKKRIAIVLIVAIVAAAALSGIGVGIYFAAQSEKFEGFVYVNGVDGDKTPLANVSVTNGRDVVKTDGNGHYVLDGWLKERFVTITIPSGYWTEESYVDTKKKDVNNKEINFYLDKKEANG